MTPFTSWHWRLENLLVGMTFILVGYWCCAVPFIFIICLHNSIEGKNLLVGITFILVGYCCYAAPFLFIIGLVCAFFLIHLCNLSLSWNSLFHLIHNPWCGCFSMYFCHNWFVDCVKLFWRMWWGGFWLDLICFVLYFRVKCILFCHLS